MANPDGTPVWYELMTTDTDSAARFYAAVVGWTVAPFEGGGGDMEYRIFNAPDGGAGGLMKLPEDAPMQPGWYTYFGVADVDAKVEQLTALGGSVHMPPQDLPGVGRMAMVADPQGVAFYLMHGDSPEDSGAFSPTALGHCSWQELRTTDQKAALDFYGTLLGWSSNEVMPMGDMGDYTFVDGSDGVRLGAMMNQGVGMPPPNWGLYFRVADVDAAKGVIEANGGTVQNGPHDVPGGGRIIIASDPQGAMIGFVSGGI